MRKSIIAAVPLCVMNLTDVGLIHIALLMLTGMICWTHEWVRNLLIGCYIVGGFWWIAASTM